jgi:hypothetical protein
MEKIPLINYGDIYQWKMTLLISSVFTVENFPSVNTKGITGGIQE